MQALMSIYVNTYACLFMSTQSSHDDVEMEEYLK